MTISGIARSASMLRRKTGIRRGQRASPRVASKDSAMAASAPISVATAAMFTVSIRAGTWIPQKARQVRAVGPGLRQHLGREVEDLRQADQKSPALRSSAKRQPRGHEDDEKDQKDTAIHPLAADHVEIGLAGVRKIGTLTLFGSEGDIDHGAIRKKKPDPGDAGSGGWHGKAYMPS